MALTLSFWQNRSTATFKYWKSFLSSRRNPATANSLAGPRRFTDCYPDFSDLISGRHLLISSFSITACVV
jgi:hypothetical protein